MLEDGEIMNSEKYSFDELMYLDINTLEAIDEVATELFEIEESAIIALGIIPPKWDQILTELNFPTVSELLHVPVVG